MTDIIRKKIIYYLVLPFRLYYNSNDLAFPIIAMATIQVRFPDKKKKNVEKILESLGLDMTTAVRMFLMRVEMIEGLPFPVSKKKLTVNGFTPEFEAEIDKAAEEKDFSPAFDTAEDAIAYLHSLNPSLKKK